LIYGTWPYRTETGGGLEEKPKGIAVLSDRRIMLASLLYGYRDARRKLAEPFSPGLKTRFSFRQVKVTAGAREFLHFNQAYINEYTFMGSPEETYFRGRIEDDWYSIRSHVPAITKRILDIGAGVGGIDIPLFHALEKPEIHLVDKASRMQRGNTFRVLDAARDLLAANGVDANKIFTYDSSDKELQSKLSAQKYDFILSTRGLGFMFPYSLYRELIRQQLAPGGVLITDLMKIGEGEVLRKDAVIEKRFEEDGMPPFSEVIGQIEADLSAKAITLFETARMIRLRVQKSA